VYNNNDTDRIQL